jgi:hypothetical protein
VRQLQHVHLHQLRNRTVRRTRVRTPGPVHNPKGGKQKLFFLRAHRRSRALNLRVKGVSMSTFSLEEVAKLQAGGNEVRGGLGAAVVCACRRRRTFVNKQRCSRRARNNRQRA